MACLAEGRGHALLPNQKDVCSAANGAAQAAENISRQKPTWFLVGLYQS